MTAVPTPAPTRSSRWLLVPLTGFAKVLVVRLHRYPGWALPTAGGLLFAVLVAVRYTSAVRFLRPAGVGL
jgi:hypothetical protein